MKLTNRLLVILLLLALTAAAQAQRGRSSVMVTPSSAMTTPSSVMTTPSLMGSPAPVRYQRPVNNPQPGRSNYYYGAGGYGYAYPGTGYRPAYDAGSYDSRGTNVGGKNFQPNTFSSDSPRF